MIIVKLSGGLGNQMFQYAAARRLAEVNNTELKIDLNSFKTDNLRKYELDKFNISAKQALPENLDLVNLSVPNRFLKRKINLEPAAFPFMRRKWPVRYINERHFHFDPMILNLGDNVYLDGTWQSEKYFSDIEETIREEFSFKSSLFNNKEIFQEIKSTSSISLHIRRGDYATNPKTNSYHGLCSLDYYNKAVEYIAEKVKDPHFYIFSDDTKWAEENLTINHVVTVISGIYTKTGFDDLRVMSMCKNHIIANSSFSWWGAWLSKHHDKIVVAPNRWFNGPGLKTTDLIPGSWKCI